MIKRIMSFLGHFVPRYTTEDWVVVERSPDVIDIVKTVEYVQPGEHYDGVVTLSSLSWFNCAWGFGGKATTRPFVPVTSKGEAS